MRHSILALAALATTVYGLPGGRRGGYGAGRRGRGRNYVPVDPVTATYKYLCPTGVKEVETVITELPADSTSVGDVVPGWSEYVTPCTYCENPAEEVTLTLPPGVLPTGPESGPITYPPGADPLETGYPGAPVDGTEEHPNYDGSPAETDAPVEPSKPAEPEPPTYTGEPGAPADTNAPDAPANTGSPAKTGTPDVPVATGAPSYTGAPGETGAPVESDAPGAPAGSDSPGAPAETNSSEAQAETSAPADTGSPDYTRAPVETGDAPTSSGDSQAPTGDAPAPTGDAPAETGAPADSSAVKPTAATSSGDVYTTAITTEFVYECPTGLSTVKTIVTEIPADGTSYSDLIPGWTTTVGICSACEGQPEMTYTLPPGVAPTGGLDGPLYTGGNPDAPLETSAGKPTPSGTGSEELPTPTGEPTPTGGAPVPTSSEGPSSEYAPIIDAPTPSAGEEAATTVISCTFTDIGDNGLTTRTLGATKEIPATASDDTYTISMSETVTVCTVCGAEPTTITLTVPAGDKTPVGDVPGETGSPIPSETGSEDTPALISGAPASAYVPVIDAPVPTAGEEVITTVVSCTYTDIGDNGLTTRSTGVTQEIPATATEDTYTVSMTETVALCTVCGDKPTSVTLTVPAYGTPAEGTPEPSSPGDDTPKPSSPVDGSPEPSTPVDEAPEPSAPVDHVTSIPVVDVPTPTAGEDVYTTVIQTTYRDVCPTGFTTVTVDITKTVPATVSTPFTVIMTESTTLCTGCGATPSRVVVTVPASYETTTIKGVPSNVPDSPAPPHKPITTEVPAVSIPASTPGEAVYTTVITKEYVTICPTGFSTATIEVTARVPETYTVPIDVVMTTTQTLCSNCDSGKPATVVLTVPVYETTVLEQSTPPAYTLTQTRTVGSAATTETVVSISGYVPIPINSAPPGYVVTETYFPTAPAPEATTTQYMTTEYETIGASGIETATLTITAEGTSTPSVDCVTSTAVCTVCGDTPKTLTLTIPRITQTMTFVPTTLYPSASAGFPVNSTEGGQVYNLPEKPQAQEAAPVELDRINSGRRMGVSAGVLVGAAVAAVLAAL